MVFSSLLFLFRFLPIMLVVYYCTPRRFRNAVLFGGSLVFYAWGEPVYIVLILFSTLVAYCAGLRLSYYQKRENKRGQICSLTIACVVSLLLLGFFKYADFFFPQLIAGPIIRYQTVEEQMVKRKETIDLFSKGIVRFMIGLGKKVLIANPIGDLFREIAGMGAADLTTVSAWLGVIAFTLQIYFDFSGYSDMAIGLGSMFGFSFPENFKHPYESKSITEFWRRWHISLGTWFKEYVYITLGGNRKGFGRQILNISIVWLLTGLWHGAYGNFVVWGIYYGILLMIEKLLWKPVFSRLPSFFMHLYTMFFVILGWGIFSWQDMADGTNYFKTLFGISGNFVNREAMYLLSSYLILLVIAIIGSVSLLRTCINRFFLPEKTMRREVCGTLFVVVVFILSVALLVNSSYNPFLYFRF